MEVIKARYTFKHILKGWALLSIVVFVAYNVLWYMTDPGRIDEFISVMFEWDVIMFTLIYCISFAGTSLVLAWLLSMTRFFRKRSIKRLILLGVCLFSANIALAYVFEVCSEYFAPSSDFIELWMSMYVFSVIASLLSFIYIEIFYCRMIIMEENKNRQMKLATLKAQLNPHFIVNSLSVLS